MLKCHRCGKEEEGTEQRICPACGYMMFPVEETKKPKERGEK